MFYEFLGYQFCTLLYFNFLYVKIQVGDAAILQKDMQLLN